MSAASCALNRMTVNGECKTAAERVLHVVLMQRAD